MTPGLGSRLTGKLLRKFGTPTDVFRASLTELEACHLPVVPARAIHTKLAHKDAEAELAQVRTLGCRLLNWSEPEYPQRLLEIYDPPPLLYVRGDVSLLNRHSISMVGTRRPTPYGNQIAERLGHDLAERGLVIVSEDRSAIRRGQVLDAVAVIADVAAHDPGAGAILWLAVPERHAAFHQAVIGLPTRLQPSPRGLRQEPRISGPHLASHVVRFS